MKLGTRSLLFGVHQILWHPYTVAKAWKFLYGRWPKGWEWFAILAHDWGYWGCSDIDGPEGVTHPKRSLVMAWRIMSFLRASLDNKLRVGSLILFHSQTTSKALKELPSELCWPDKASVAFDPPWFYILRARLTGEMAEYRAAAAKARVVCGTATDRQWYSWLRRKNIQRAVSNTTHV